MAVTSETATELGAPRRKPTMSPKISLGAIWGSPWLLVLLAAAAGHAFAMHGLGIYTAMQAGSIYDLGEEVIFAEEFIFRVPLVLGILALFMRELGARALLLATLIAMVMNNINFFDGILHRFLDQNDLYPLVLRRGDPTNAVNSQIPISFTYLFVYLALVVSVLIKARRTISRIFLLLIMTATLGTTTLFHQLLVDGALVIAIDQERMINRQHLTAIVTVPDEATFQRLCSASATTCATGGVNGPPPAAHPALNQAIIQSFERLKSGSIASNTHTEALRVGALDLDLRGMQFALHREGERYRLAVDMGSYNHLPARYKVYFGTLMIFAHMWWVYGGLALLSFHRSRFAWRFAKQLTD